MSLTPVATGLTAPTAAAVAPSQPSELFVADQIGKIWTVDTSGTNAPRVFGDVSRLIGGPLGCSDPVNGSWGYDERGLLGIAFHPGYARNGLVYTYLATAPTGCGVYGWTPDDLPNHRNILIEWRVKNPTSPTAKIDPNSARTVLSFSNPYYDHNGGQLAFGPDGMLYIGTGDGGNEDGQNPLSYDENGQLRACTQMVCTKVGQSKGGNAQDLSKLNGKILRIDPVASGGGPYRIPRGNPFIGRAGARGEIWAYGLRNPFSFSFTSRGLVAGDVGQEDVEELDLIQRGANYGWPIKEGTFPFHNGDEVPYNPSLDAFESYLGNNGWVVGSENSPGTPSGLTDPLFEYDHSQGIAVIAGYDYTGTATPALNGTYVFGDYSNETYTSGRLFARFGDGTVGEIATTFGNTGGLVRGLGRDQRGEIYVLGNPDGSPSGNSGIVWKLTSAP